MPGKRMTVTQTIDGIEGAIHFCADDESWWGERGGTLDGPFETLTEAEAMVMPFRQRR